MKEIHVNKRNMFSSRMSCEFFTTMVQYWDCTNRRPEYVEFVEFAMARLMGLPGKFETPFVRIYLRISSFRFLDALQAVQENSDQSWPLPSNVPTPCPSKFTWFPPMNQATVAFR